MQVNLTTLQKEAIDAAEKAKPSPDPKYWAKKNCTHCYGRGLEGTVTRKIKGNTVVNGALCKCASRAYSRWRDRWVADYLSKHAEPVAESV